MKEIELKQISEDLIEEFKQDNMVIGRLTEKFLRIVYPSYLLNKDNIEELMDPCGKEFLQNMTFFRISSCTADNVEEVFKEVNRRFEKLFTALHSINISIAFGIISCDGVTNLVLGVAKQSDVASVKTLTQGMLSGIDMEQIKPKFTSGKSDTRHQGILSGVPSLYVKDEKQRFSLSSIMRGLNGQDYTLLFLSKPVSQEEVNLQISELISIRDSAFSVSKRNISRSKGFSQSMTDTESHTDTSNTSAGQKAKRIGAAAGLGAGIAGGAVTAIGGAHAVAGTVASAAGGLAGILAPGPITGFLAKNAVGLSASVLTHTGAAIANTAGAGLVTAVGSTVLPVAGMFLGSIIGGAFLDGKSTSKGMSHAVTESLNGNGTVSGEIQNGVAIEIMNYANTAIERLKAGCNNGMWQTAIVYSGESESSRNVIQACLSGELSKLDAEKLPMCSFKPNQSEGEVLRIPRFLDCHNQNPLCSYINSSELGLLCTVPTESVPDFELRLEKKFPLQASRSQNEKIRIGSLTDGRRLLKNMPFALSESDLNKHTFVCGITGSGKTTTVKKILLEAKKPFFVIESAKKEYRNLKTQKVVYTLGQPEINAPKINPFYIMPGISPQVHIDFLKDLFNASFSFYGPMQYILETCLHSVYKHKGWNLTLGYHPLLTNVKNSADLFEGGYLNKAYSKKAHKFLFPTMQDLKDEIARYIDKELKYEGEVAGNIKTAMLVRLENLCVGAKGYTFNTNDCIDFAGLLKSNAVFELEGLADDSDKAFAVGLMIVFIDEYRKVNKELYGSKKIGLQHLMVIEEAHRLLKNIETERFSETMGNPKGKAVEHFTNMIAEMRSYGQGVIVAEQIPTKIAPDVIKNSSTKIVQRVVSADDQQIIANTIGVPPDDAIQLGFLETGYAYCHKEGMVLPAPVKVSSTFMLEDGNISHLDEYTSDEALYNRNIDRFGLINLDLVRNFFRENDSVKCKVIALLNTLMTEKEPICIDACNKLMDWIEYKIKHSNLVLMFVDDLAKITSKYLSEVMIKLTLNGIYCLSELPDNETVNLLEHTLYVPTDEKIKEIKHILKKLYIGDLGAYAKNTVSALIRRTLKQDTDLEATVKEYFIDASDDTVEQIISIINNKDK